MAREAQIVSRLTLKKGNVNYLGINQGHTEDVSSGNGPYIGTVNVTEDGTDIDLSSLDVLGLCEVRNISSDETNYIRLGTWNNSESTFNPFMKIYPGKGYVFRLDDLLETEFSGTGTGAGDALTLRAKSFLATGILQVSVFED